MASTKVTTAADLLAMPDDGRDHELIEGVLVEVSPAGYDSSGIAIAISSPLSLFARTHGLGRVTGADGGYWFEQDPDTVRAPDVAFVRTERLPPRHERTGFLQLIPDLAVEVVSPSDRQRDIDEKVAYYLEHGVPLVWVAYPRTSTVDAHRRDQPAVTYREGDVLTAGDLLPGFRLPVAEIFA